MWIDNDAMEKLMRYTKVNSPEEVEKELGIDKWKGVRLKISTPDDYHKRIDSLIPSEYKDNKRYYITSEGRVVRVHGGADYLEDTAWYPLGNIDKVKNLDVYPFPQPNWIRVKMSQNFQGKQGF